jgi:hypothetical protein
MPLLKRSFCSASSQCHLLARDRPDYALGSFTAKLHGWAHPRRFIVVR